MTHDHTPHDHERCPICALEQLAAAPSQQVLLAALGDVVRLRSSQPRSAVRALLFLESQPARAPPPVS